MTIFTKEEEKQLRKYLSDEELKAISRIRKKANKVDYTSKVDEILKTFPNASAFAFKNAENKLPARTTIVTIHNTYANVEYKFGPHSKYESMRLSLLNGGIKSIWFTDALSNYEQSVITFKDKFRYTITIFCDKVVDVRLDYDDYKNLIYRTYTADYEQLIAVKTKDDARKLIQSMFYNTQNVLIDRFNNHIASFSKQLNESKALLDDIKSIKLTLKEIK